MTRAGADPAAPAYLPTPKLTCRAPPRICTYLPTCLPAPGICSYQRGHAKGAAATACHDFWYGMNGCCVRCERAVSTTGTLPEAGALTARKHFLCKICSLSALSLPRKPQSLAYPPTLPHPERQPEPGRPNTLPTYPAALIDTCPGHPPTLETRRNPVRRNS